MGFQSSWENGPAHSVPAGFVPPSQGGLLTVDGKPQLSPSVEQALAERFPTYRITWLDAAWGMSGWMISEQWKANDPRWREVQEGKRDPRKTFDTIHRFGADTRQDDILGFIENNMAQVPDPVKEAERAVELAMKRLQDAQERATNAVVEQGTQRIMDESDHTRAVRAGLETAHPMVSGANFTEREPKRLL